MSGHINILQTNSSYSLEYFLQTMCKPVSLVDGSSSEKKVYSPIQVMSLKKDKKPMLQLKCTAKLTLLFPLNCKVPQVQCWLDKAQLHKQWPLLNFFTAHWTHSVNTILFLFLFKVYEAWAFYSFCNDKFENRKYWTQELYCRPIFLYKLITHLLIANPDWLNCFVIFE